MITYDEDDHTRRNRDAATANTIAAALSERFGGYLRLRTRYRLAHDAIDQARAEAEPMQRRDQAFEGGHQ